MSVHLVTFGKIGTQIHLERALCGFFAFHLGFYDLVEVPAPALGLFWVSDITMDFSKLVS
jgi:hypothetical protein